MIIKKISFIFKVTSFDEEEPAAEEGAEGGEGGEEEEMYEFVGIAEKLSYLAPLIRIIALIHSFIAFAIMVAYYHLKIPLVIFKREKEVRINYKYHSLL